VHLSPAIQSKQCFSCLPQTCQTYLVKPGDTCWSIAASAGITLTTLLGYNLTINPSCTNLLSGFNICLSPSAGTYTLTTIAGATVTKTDTFATSTVPAPGPTPFKTTPKCGKYYQVQTNDFCQLISLTASIPLALFEQINPSIDAGCDNLVPRFYYCVFPTADWNATAIDNRTSTTVGADAARHDGRVLRVARRREWGHLLGVGAAVRCDARAVAGVEPAAEQHVYESAAWGGVLRGWAEHELDDDECDCLVHDGCSAGADAARDDRRVFPVACYCERGLLRAD
jgi:LysM repeat protein